jgi:hypothetical protein
MTRSSTRERIVARANGTLGGDEHIVGAARVWATDTRSGVPLLFRQRHRYDLVVTDQRLILLARPRRVRVPWRRARRQPDAPAVAKRHGAFTILHIRRNAPLAQLRLGYDDGVALVLEFHPTDRGVARDLTGYIHRARHAPQAR